MKATGMRTNATVVEGIKPFAIKNRVQKLFKLVRCNHLTGDISFDGIPQTETLNHLTANRAKIPQKRPPSKVRVSCLFYFVAPIDNVTTCFAA